jgi:DNA-binding MarR family transcriptional regulator
MVDQLREDDLNAALELLFFGYRSFVTGPDRILEQSGMSRVHHRVLYFVGRNPGLSVGALTEVLGVSKQALHAPLRQLVERGLVTARRAEHDRRLKRLSLTDAGVRLEEELSGSQRRRLAAIFMLLGPSDEAAWRRVMDELRREESS